MYNIIVILFEVLIIWLIKIIRGITIISIIFYHLTISGISNLLLFPFQFMQFCGVATFFLLSGYALMEQYQSRKNYLNGFLLKKLSRIYFSYILMFIPYLIYELCINSKINWIEELLGILTFSFEGYNFGNLNLYIPLQLVYVFFVVIFLVVLSLFITGRNCGIFCSIDYIFNSD